MFLEQSVHRLPAQVANYLVTRLKNKNHNVKWKCLVIIKHVALKGSPSFRRDMMRDLPVIKECLQVPPSDSVLAPPRLMPGL